MTSRWLVVVLATVLLCAGNARGTVWYVDSTAPAGGAGTSWATAINDLQVLLSAAPVANGDEIRVARGTYRPTTAGGVRSSTFPISKSITIHGGYLGLAGGANADTFVSDPLQTVLSGDLNGNDGPNFANTSENSLRVVSVGLGAGSGNVIIERFSIQGGNANSGGWLTGGGLFVNFGWTVTVRNCDFRANQSSSAGGAVELLGGTSTFVQCMFVGNRSSGTYGGAIDNGVNSGVRLVNCGFFGNSLTGAGALTGGGGAIYLTGPGQIANCLFSGNSVSGINAAAGGAISAASGATTITNCTFSSNTSTAYGAATIALSGANISVTNSIFWGNSASLASAQNNVTGTGTNAFAYCDVQGGVSGTGNINADPKFTFPLGVDGVAGTLDDNLTLKIGYPGSPCIDAGNSAALPPDFADVNQNGNTGETLPVDYAFHTRRLDDPLTPDTGTGGAPMVDMGAFEAVSNAAAVGPVVYVDATGAGDNSGLAGDSWTTALANPVSAIYLATAYPAVVQEIRFAGGTYRPSTASLLTWMTLTRTSSLLVRGGYAGRVFSTSPDTRDLKAFPTILSGDALNNDGASFANRTDNAVHILEVNGNGHVIDGLQFKGGGTPNNNSYAGGLVDRGNSTLVRDCLFTDNLSGAEAGGYDKENFTPSTLLRCDFIANRGVTGGGAQIYDGGVNFVNCRFLGNIATSKGGGAYVRGGLSSFTNCLFSGNSATGAGSSGGAIYDNGQTLPIQFCTFTGNSAPAGRGGAIFANPLSPLSVVGCILWGDSAPTNPEVELLSAAPNFANCIIQGGFGGTNIVNANPGFVGAAGVDGVLGTSDDNPAIPAGSPAIDLADPAQLPADVADLNNNGNTAEPLPLDMLGNPRVLEGSLVGASRPDAGCSEFPTSVVNLSTAASFLTIGQAIGAASSGQSILALASSFAAEPVINFNGLALNLGSTADIAQPSGGLYTMANGSLLETASDRACSLSGEVRVPPGASASVQTGTLNVGASAKVTLFGGSTLSTNAATTNSSGTVLGLPGSTLFTSGSLTLGGPSTLQSSNIGAGAMTISAQTNWTGSSVSASGLTIQNTGRFTGSGNVYAPVTNSGRVYTVGNTLFVGNLTNNAGGVITVQIGTATLIGTLVNNGTINGLLSNPPMPPPGSDEGTVAFYRGYSDAERTSLGDGMFIRGDYIAGAASSLSLPDAVWKLSVAGSYDVAINSNANYDMRLAELNLAKPDNGPSTIEAMSLDRGAVLAGLDRTLPGSYPIGTLRIGAGANVSTADNRDNANDGQGNCEAVYCENLIVESGASLTATSCRVYYKTLTNGGSITTPANVIRIPPPCAGDFTGDGVVNTFDLSAFLSKFGLLVPPGTPQDMNNDGIVNTFDLSLFLANFGKQC